MECPPCSWFTRWQAHSYIYLIICCFYVKFNSQGHIATGSLQVGETSAYCTVNHWASASNYQLSNIKRPARDSNRRPQRLEARTLTTTPPSPLAHIYKETNEVRHEYFNYKGYFSLVLLALVDTEYKFLWVNIGASGSSSDAQIFDHSKLKRIENGTLRLPPPEPLGPGGQNLHYLLLGDDAFTIMLCLVKPYSRRKMSRDERIANYRISRGHRVLENAFGIL